MVSITAICILLIVVIIGYVIGFTGCPFLFVLFLPVILLVLLSTVLLLIADLTWWLVPQDMRKDYQTRKTRFKAIVIACLIFLFLGGWLINQHYLPQILHPISLLGNAGFLIFTVFLAWCLLKSIKKGTLIIGTLLFTSFIFLLISLTPSTIEHTDSSSISTLKSLPYLDWVPAEETIEKSGVTKYNPKLSCDGLNLFCLRAESKAFLMNMSGNILHTWSAGKNANFSYVKIYGNSDLLGGIHDGVLTRLGWNSNIRWIKKIRFHHEIAVDENNDIYVLDSTDEMVFRFNLPLPILNDYILILSPDGKTKKKIDLFEVLKSQIPFNTAIKMYRQIINLKTFGKTVATRTKVDFAFTGDTPFDIFHNNTITIIDRDIEGLCKKGDLLISARQLDLIGIVDVEKEQLIWTWGPGNLSRQHQPTLLENGNIMIYDNGLERGYSRIVELEPFTKKIVWQYKANPPEQFYSPTGGGCQRLPNGNTLITEEYKGRVFEITKSGQIIWEYYTPYIKGTTRASIYRMTRITDPENYPILKEMTF